MMKLLLVAFLAAFAVQQSSSILPGLSLGGSASASGSGGLGGILAPVTGILTPVTSILGGITGAGGGLLDLNGLFGNLLGDLDLNSLTGVVGTVISTATGTLLTGLGAIAIALGPVSAVAAGAVNIVATTVGTGIQAITSVAGSIGVGPIASVAGAITSVIPQIASTLSTNAANPESQILTLIGQLNTATAANKPAIQTGLDAALAAAAQLSITALQTALGLAARLVAAKIALDAATLSSIASIISKAVSDVTAAFNSPSGQITALISSGRNVPAALVQKLVDSATSIAIVAMTTSFTLAAQIAANVNVSGNIQILINLSANLKSVTAVLQAVITAGLDVSGQLTLFLLYINGFIANIAAVVSGCTCP